MTYNGWYAIKRNQTRSKLDYGSIIYRSARKSYLKTLDPIYHGGLRLVLLEPLEHPPAESLYAEANEAPADIRSHKLALQYYVKLRSCPTNWAHQVFHPKYKELFQKNEKAIKPFGLQIETIIGEAEVDLTEIHKTIIPDIPPWTIRTPNIIFHKNKTHPLIFQEELKKVKEKYPKHSHIFKDGSKVDKITGCATKRKKFLKTSPKWYLYIQYRSLCNQHGSWPHLRIKK